MSKFKVGDKVKIRKDSKYYNGGALNPIDTQGEVTLLRKYNLGIKVKWLNGTTNVYNELDLEFLQFTKADLKDGMRCICDEKKTWYVCGKKLITDSGSECGYISDISDNFVVKRGRGRINKIIDRDGTVLFERNPEKRTVTLELTGEQIEQLKTQLNIEVK